MVAGLNVFAVAGTGASIWLNQQPWFQDLTAGLVLAMPGPGLVWQCVQALAVLVGLPAALTVAARRSMALRRKRRLDLLPTARVSVEVLAGGPDPWIPSGQLVFRRLDSPALAAPASRPALRDSGQVEVESLVFRIVPPFLLLVALVNATTGTERMRQTIWPLLAGAVLIAWLGHQARRSTARETAAAAEPESEALPECESCRRAAGTVTVRFLDAVTFHVCALCLNAGSHAAMSHQAVAAETRREVQS
jgi:hypothetical protein